jgi:hypothetical protein
MSREELINILKTNPDNILDRDVYHEVLGYGKIAGYCVKVSANYYRLLIVNSSNEFNEEKKKQLENENPLHIIPNVFSKKTLTNKKEFAKYVKFVNQEFIVENSKVNFTNNESLLINYNQYYIISTTPYYLGLLTINPPKINVISNQIVNELI